MSDIRCENEQNEMLNLTFACLALRSDLEHGPMITFSNRLSSLSVEKSSFAVFFSSVIRTSLFTKLDLKRNRFDTFLGHALHMEDLNYGNATIEQRRISLLLEPANISFCIFRLCKSNDAKGGAIFSVVDLILYQCWFSYNSAAKGGHIYSNGMIEAISVTFEGGYSSEASGIANEDCDEKVVDLQLVTFNDLRSTKFSSFLRDATGLINIRGINVSGNRADESTAGFIVYRSNVKMSNSLLFELHAKDNAGIVLRHAEGCNMETTLFSVMLSYRTQRFAVKPSGADKMSSFMEFRFPQSRESSLSLT